MDIVYRILHLLINMEWFIILSIMTSSEKNFNEPETFH